MEQKSRVERGEVVRIVHRSISQRKKFKFSKHKQIKKNMSSQKQVQKTIYILNVHATSIPPPGTRH